jgi:hypothetical protein
LAIYLKKNELVFLDNDELRYKGELTAVYALYKVEYATTASCGYFNHRRLFIMHKFFFYS